MTAGPVLTAEGAHPTVTVCQADDIFCHTRLVRELGSPEEAREAVRRLAGEGVDFVKLVSDSLLVPVHISDELVAAIVDQAHLEGLEAVGHVAEPWFMEAAADAGLDGFVHSNMNVIGETRARELASVLAGHQTPVTTTLSAALVYGEAKVRERLTWGGTVGGSDPRLGHHEAARALGLSSDLGTLEPGKLAEAR